MSQWGEKISEKKSSQKSRLILTINNYVDVITFDGVVHFQENSKRFVIGILTKNLALNFSGVLFFVGLGFSLKWWYKDQFFNTLLKQNLPALSESQQEISWETSDYVLKKQNQKFIERIKKLSKNFLGNKSISFANKSSVSSNLPEREQLERLDLYTNYVGIKFKAPWQKHVYQRFSGVFPEFTQINRQKVSRNFTKKKVEKRFSFWSKNKYTIWKQPFPENWFKLSARGFYFLNEGPQFDQFTVNLFQPTSRLLLLNKKKPNFFICCRKSIVCSLNSLNFPFFGNTKKNGFTTTHLYSNKSNKNIKKILDTRLPKLKIIFKNSNKLVKVKNNKNNLVYSKDKKPPSIKTLSYPLQLTKTMFGWHPPIDALILNSYLDEIPYKLESLFLTRLFNQTNNEILNLVETSSNQSVSVDKLYISEINKIDSQIKTLNELNQLFSRKSTKELKNETFLKKSQFFEIKQLLKNELQLLINKLPLDFVSEDFPNEENELKTKKLTGDSTFEKFQNVIDKDKNTSKTFVNVNSKEINQRINAEKNQVLTNYEENDSFDSLNLLNTLNFTFNNLSSLKTPPILLTTNNDASFWMWKLFMDNPFSHTTTKSIRKSLFFFKQKKNVNQNSTVVFRKIGTNLVWEIYQQPNYDQHLLSNLKKRIFHKNFHQLKKLKNINSGNNNKILVKQKKVTIKNINDINPVDTKIHFVNPKLPKLKWMSGYVYPDTESVLLKTNLYQWLSKKNILTFTNNYSHQIFAKQLKNKPDLTLSFFYPKSFLSPRRVYNFLDKACLTTRRIPITPSTFLLRFFQQQIPKLEKKENLQDWIVNTNPYALDGNAGNAFYTIRDGNDDNTGNSTMRRAHYLRYAGIPSLMKCKEQIESSGDKINDTLEKHKIPLVYGIIHNDTVTSIKNKELFNKPKNPENVSNRTSPSITCVSQPLLPYQKFNHHLADFPGFAQPQQFFITLPQISQGNDSVTLVTPKDSVINTTRNKSDKEDITQSRKSHTSALYPPLTNVPSSDPLLNISALPMRTIEDGNQRACSALPKAFEDEQALRSIEDGNDNKEVFEDGNGVNSGNHVAVHTTFVRKPEKVMYSTKDEIANRLHVDVDNPYYDCNTRKTAYNGIVVQRNNLTKDFQPFKGSLEQSSIWGTRFLGPENPLTNRQCHFFGQRQVSPLDTNSFQRDYLRQLGKEIVTQSNLKGFTEKLPSIERTKILSFSKRVNSFFFKKRKYSYLLEKQDQWHLLFQEQLRTALEDKRKYPPLTPEAEEIKNSNFERIKISAPLIMVRFPKEKGNGSTPSSNLQIKLGTGNGNAELKKSSTIKNGNDGKEQKKIRKNEKVQHKLQHNTFWRPFSYFKENSHYSVFENESQKLLVNQFYPFSTETYSLESNNALWLNKQKNWIPFSELYINIITASNSRSFLKRDKVYYINSPQHYSSLTAFAYPILFDNTSAHKVNLTSCEGNVLLLTREDDNTAEHQRWYPEGGKHQTIKNVTQLRKLQEKYLSNSTNNTTKSKKLLPYFNVATNLQWLIQEPLTPNSWAVLNQWFFLVSLLCWIEQILLENVFPSLFALEQLLLGGTGVKANDRTRVIRVSRGTTPKFQDLAGIDGLLGELSELVLFLRGQQSVGERLLNKKNSYGVLLTGPPGTGKTFLVRALANEAGVPVLILSASTLGANKLNSTKPSWSIRHAFRRAKQLTPCILFIDEIDALGKSRGNIVTDINEIVAGTTSPTFGGNTGTGHLNQSINASTSSEIELEHFWQSWPTVPKGLINKWTYPLKSTLLQESNQINRYSLCEENIFSLMNTANNDKVISHFSTNITEQNGTLNSTRGTLKAATRNSSVQTGGITSDENIQSYNHEQSPNSNEVWNSFGSTDHTVNNRVTAGENSKRKFGPLTQLLVSMDGVSNLSGILIMGATNRPELLDPALTRPGRFERTIRIEKPSEQKRIEILQLYSHNLGVQHQIPWSYFANRTRGLTAADLAVAMNYSSLKAIVQGSTHTVETIEYGLDSITRFSTTPFCRLSTTSDAWSSKKKIQVKNRITKKV